MILSSFAQAIVLNEIVLDCVELTSCKIQVSFSHKSVTFRLMKSNLNLIWTASVEIPPICSFLFKLRSFCLNLELSLVLGFKQVSFASSQAEIDLKSGLIVNLVLDDNDGLHLIRSAPSGK